MSEEEKALESAVYALVGSYLKRRVKLKYDLDRPSPQATDKEKSDYWGKNSDLARDAFLALRARTGDDFIEYFVGTLCSVPQLLPEPAFLLLSKRLYEETQRVRILTMLALSARS